MAKRIRCVPPNTPVEVTCRTTQSRRLLRPSEELNDIIIGILGKAIEMCPLLLHAFIVMSNHLHLLTTVPNAATVSRFMNYVNSNIAREVARLHDWNARLWGRRYTAIDILDDAALIGRLRYIMSHGCKEGLVVKPTDWPGASSLPALLHGEQLHGTWYDRTKQYRASRRGQEPDPSLFAEAVNLPIAPIPCWAHLTPEEYQRRCAAIARDIEQETAETIRQTGRTPLGREWVVCQDPHSRPTEVNRSPAPPCHTTDLRLRREHIRGYHEFLHAYRSASIRFRRGELDVNFPPNCFPPPRPFIAATELSGRQPTRHPPDSSVGRHPDTLRAKHPPP